MDRRNFLKKLGIGIAVAPVVPAVAKAVKSENVGIQKRTFVDGVGDDFVFDVDEAINDPQSPSGNGTIKVVDHPLFLDAYSQKMIEHKADLDRAMLFGIDPAIDAMDATGYAMGLWVSTGENS